MKLQLLLLAFASFSSAAHATAPWTKYSTSTKGNPTIWRIRTEKDLQKVLASQVSSVRACYYIINQAQKVGLEAQAARFFRTRQSKSPWDPKLQIIYAYATHVSGGPNSRAYFKSDPKNQDLVWEYSIASRWVPEALAKVSHSPELLTMAAMVQSRISNQYYSSSRVKWPEVAEWFQKANRLDPRWADSFYGYGEGQLRFALQEKLRKRPFSATLAKSESLLMRAQNLDPGLKGSCARLLAVVAARQEQPEKQLKYIDVLLKTYPSYQKDPYWGKIRGKVAASIQAER